MNNHDAIAQGLAKELKATCQKTGEGELGLFTMLKIDWYTWTLPNKKEIFAAFHNGCVHVGEKHNISIAPGIPLSDPNLLEHIKTKIKATPNVYK